MFDASATRCSVRAQTHPELTTSLPDPRPVQPRDHPQHDGQERRRDEQTAVMEQFIAMSELQRICRRNRLLDGFGRLLEGDTSYTAS
jgi:hypothetical protein